MKQCIPFFVLLFSALSAHAGEQAKAGLITFEITYEDQENGSGMGFDDPTEGEARRNTLTEVMTYVTGLLDHIGRVEVVVRESIEDTSLSALPATGAPLFGEEPGFYNGHAFEHIVNLVDPCRLDNCGEDLPDMEIRVNFAKSFHIGDGPPDLGQYDLYSVLLKQVMHGLGFYALTGADGASSIGDDVLTVFESLLRFNGQPLWHGDGSYAQSLSALTSGDGLISFSGNQATAAFGRAPTLQAPTSFQSGISLVHWDSETAENAVMVHPFPTGVTRRVLQNFEKAVLTDLGYTLAPDGGAAKTLVYPWVSNSDDFTSTLVVNNYSDRNAALTLTARRANGAGVETVNRTLSPRSMLKETADSLFPTLGRGPGVAVTVTSDVAEVRGRWVTNDRPASVPSQGIAVDLTANSKRLGTTLMFGFLPGNNEFIAAPVMMNTGTTNANLTLYSYREDGTLINTTRITEVAPLEPLVLLVTNADTGDGYAVLQADSNAITGVVFVFNSLGQTAIGNATAIDDFVPPPE